MSRKTIRFSFICDGIGFQRSCLCDGGAVKWQLCDMTMDTNEDFLLAFIGILWKLTRQHVFGEKGTSFRSKVCLLLKLNDD
jgi:hypothetical protein